MKKERMSNPKCTNKQKRLYNKKKLLYNLLSFIVKFILKL